MAYIQKGDLFEARGKHWIATTDGYTKLIREDSGSNEIEYATAVGAIKAHPADGAGSEAEFVYSRERISLVKRAADL